MTQNRGITGVYITPWSIALLEKLVDPHLVKIFPVFHGTWKCIALISFHCSLF
jgi:hypothetical protein